MKECEVKVADFKKEIETIKAKIKTIEKKKVHGALSQKVQQQVEELLQQVHRIVRSAYHGGDFEGNHCRKFICNADKVMDSIEALLLSIPDDDRAADCWITMSCRLETCMW